MEKLEHAQVDADVIKSVKQTGNLANQEEHDKTPIQAIRENPWVMLWCSYAVWMLVLNSFENQAGGAVLGIPQFRKVSGHNDKNLTQMVTNLGRTSGISSKTVMFYLFRGSRRSAEHPLHRTFTSLFLSYGLDTDEVQCVHRLPRNRLYRR